MRKNRKVWTTILILYVGFIFWNSYCSADVSSMESQGVLAFLISVLTKLHIKPDFLTEHLVRKSAHFLEYAVLGLILRHTCLLYRQAQMDRRGGNPSDTERFLYRNIVLAQLIPFVDETIQLFSEGRSGQISDVWLDMLGVACGTLLYFLVNRYLLRLFPKRRRRR